MHPIQEPGGLQERLLGSFGTVCCGLRRRFNAWLTTSWRRFSLRGSPRRFPRHKDGHPQTEEYKQETRRGAYHFQNLGLDPLMMLRPSVHGCCLCFCWAEKLPGFAGLLAFLPRLKLHRTRQLSPILRRAELGAAVFSFGHAMGTSLAGSHGNASNGGLSPDGCNWDSTWGGADRGTMRSWTLTSDWSFPLVFKNGDLTCNVILLSTP